MRWTSPLAALVTLVVCNGAYQAGAQPVFTGIMPNSSITDGGIVQTVIGTGLDQVSNAMLKITLLSNNIPSTIFFWPCVPISSTSMTCGSTLAKIPFPQSFPFPNATNSPSWKLNMPGTTDWQYNLTATSNVTGQPVTPLTGQLGVYTEPALQMIAPNPTMYAVDTRITITGISLQSGYGFRGSDISVTVSLGLPSLSTVCSNVTVSDTAITCLPPTIDKNDFRYNTPGLVPITVYIGNYMFSAGQLNYEYTEKFAIVMSVMIAVLAFIIAVSVVFAVMAILNCYDTPGMMPDGEGQQAFKSPNKDDDSVSDDEKSSKHHSKKGRHSKGEYEDTYEETYTNIAYSSDTKVTRQHSRDVEVKF